MAGHLPNRDPALRQHRLQHVAVYVVEPELSALETVREPRVINPRAMHDRRLQVVVCTGCSATLNPKSSVDPYVIPPLIPPPAIQIENAFP